MLNFLVKRLFGLLPTLAIVAVLVFLFVHLLPGDPARLAAGPEADDATVALVRADLGLDRPLPAQFANFFTKIAHGDFGMSTRSKRPVSTEIGERFMPTLMLTLVSMVWSTLLGMAIGIASAVWRNRWPDRLGMTIAVSGISFPAFALGMLLMEVFSVKLGWLPVVPDGSWKSYVLPSLTLGAAVAAVMARDVAYRWLNNARQRVGPVDETAAKDAQNTADFLHKSGVIPAAYDTSKLLDRSYAGAFAAPAQKTAAAQ